MEEIMKIITNMSGKYSATFIFDDFVKMVAISLSNSTDILHDKVWKKRENQYKTIISKYTKEEFETCIDLLSLKEIEVTKFIDDIVSLEEVEDAFKRLTSGKDEAIKILVDPKREDS